MLASDTPFLRQAQAPQMSSEQLAQLQLQIQNAQAGGAQLPGLALVPELAGLGGPMFAADLPQALHSAPGLDMVEAAGVGTKRRRAGRPRKSESADPSQPKVDRRRTVSSKARPKRWNAEEDLMLREAVAKHKEKSWKDIASLVPGRNHVQCLQRWKKVLKPGLKKGHWSQEEDKQLRILADGTGHRNWGDVAKNIAGRTAKQCRERWLHHLKPSIRKGPWTEEDDELLRVAVKDVGSLRWAEIARRVPGRTENAVKIRWKAINRPEGGKSAKSERSSRHTAHTALGALPAPSGLDFDEAALGADILSSLPQASAAAAAAAAAKAADPSLQSSPSHDAGPSGVVDQGLGDIAAQSSVAAEVAAAAAAAQAASGLGEEPSAKRAKADR